MLFSIKEIRTCHIIFRNMFLSEERYFTPCFVFHIIRIIRITLLTEPTRFGTPFFTVDYIDKM